MKRVLSESFGCAAPCFHREQCSDELSVASHISRCDGKGVFEGGAYRCSIHDVSVRDVVEIGLFVSIRLTSRGGRKAPAVASTLGSRWERADTSRGGGGGGGGGARGVNNSGGSTARKRNGARVNKTVSPPINVVKLLSFFKSNHVVLTGLPMVAAEEKRRGEKREGESRGKGEGCEAMRGNGGRRGNAGDSPGQAERGRMSCRVCRVMR
jgi:hypothetical protein